MSSFLNELQGEPMDFRIFLRMDSDTFEDLLTLVTPLIQRQKTIMREPVSARDRLSITLRYLATGIYVIIIIIIIIIMLMLRLV